MEDKGNERGGRTVALLTATSGFGGMGVLGMVAYFGVLIGIFYFMMIRPQKKKQKAVDEMQNNIAVGDWIMTNGGFFGKVVDTVNEYLLVEFGTNKSVIIPIVKDAVASVGEPDLTRKRVEEKVVEDDDDEYYDDEDDYYDEEDFLDKDDK